MKFTLQFFLALLFTQVNLQAQNFEALDSLSSLITSKYHVKGVAMVGVKDGQIVYSKGFGDANENFAMSEETPIYIASNTKAFVALAMLKLINQGKINLDDSLTKYIERKYFPDSIEVESITVKDLLAHNTGLSNDPITFRTSTSGEYPENLQELLKFTGYRSQEKKGEKEFSYSNFGYLLCGIVIENVSGKNWKEYLETEILSELNLKDTHPYIPKGPEMEKMALPYNFKTAEPLKLVKQDNTLHAAGGLVTNLKDMGQWLTFVSSENPKFKKLKEKDLNGYNDNLITFNDSFGPITIQGYGYGWYHGNVLGEKINFHAGGFSGHNSFISYLPEKNMGFFIFVNDNSNLRLAALQLTFMYYQIITGNKELEKSYPIFEKRIQSTYENYKTDSLTIINPTVTSLPTGSFYNDKYGHLNIESHPDRYEITLGKNLRSIVFKGETDTEVIVQFVPQKSVHFTIEGTDMDVRLKYGDDYGYFSRLPDE